MPMVSTTIKHHNASVTQAHKQKHLCIILVIPITVPQYCLCALSFFSRAFAAIHGNAASSLQLENGFASSGISQSLHNRRDHCGHHHCVVLIFCARNLGQGGTYELMILVFVHCLVLPFSCSVYSILYLLLCVSFESRLSLILVRSGSRLYLNI